MRLPARVILLNGISSAGKTTLARAIQDESDVPFVYWGIDTLFGLIPPNWGGGRDGPLSRDGFWYDRTGHDTDGHPVLVVRYGEVGYRMLRSGVPRLPHCARSRPPLRHDCRHDHGNARRAGQGRTGATIGR